ncbi:hypothetical protein EF888_05925 [Silicimonas algicola]|nr:hypothetical protein [Silicimonas algicola]AZQ66718.1 hypothetical protein EF888_05925 [Silicimonas algicola]
MNASSSTGPRTAEGKRIVAGNARRHGATSATDPEVTERVLRIILDAPEPTLGDAMFGERRMQVALRLAAAEARALQTETAARRTPIEAPECTAQDTLLRCLLEVPSDTPGLRGIATEVLEGALQEQAARRTAFEREKRLARRYVSEARAELRKARAAWIEHLVEERAPCPAETAKSDFPKQTKNSTISRS